MGATSSDQISVDEVDYVMFNPESGTSDHCDAPTDMIVDSASSKTNDAHASSSETEESNDDGGDFREVNEHSDIHSRYPRRTRQARKRCWHMAGTAKAPTQVTTSDDPTINEALGATPTEREKLLNAIDEELTSLQDKTTWVEDEYRMSKLLPAHVILKVKQDGEDSVD